MSSLYLHNYKIDSIFQLLGEHENDMSYSVAWALSNSSSFLYQVLKKLGVKQIFDIDSIDINLQSYEKNRGITDIEIIYEDVFHIIIESKRGWILPSRTQLEKYSKRKSFLLSRANYKAIVSLSECSCDYAINNLEVTSVNGIDIIPMSWKELCLLAEKAKRSCSHKETHLLDELLTYFKGLITMQNINSNMVYVVSIANNTPDGWEISWIDIIEQKKRYFHPMGINGWPKDPPNYIGFRYYGKLQSIHHIEKYDVVKNLHKCIPEIPSFNEDTPYFVYKLSKPIKPINTVKTGKVYPNGRVWCMLDTLLISKTIAEARNLTQKRLAE